MIGQCDGGGGKPHHLRYLWWDDHHNLNYKLALITNLVHVINRHGESEFLACVFPFPFCSYIIPVSVFSVLFLPSLSVSVIMSSPPITMLSFMFFLFYFLSHWTLSFQFKFKANHRLVEIEKREIRKETPINWFVCSLSLDWWLSSCVSSLWSTFSSSR